MKFISPSTTLMFFGAIPIIGIPVGLRHITKNDKRYDKYRFSGVIEFIPFMSPVCIDYRSTPKNNS